MKKLAQKRSVPSVLDPEVDSPELEARLLEGVRSKFSPYSRKGLEAVMERIKRELAAEKKRKRQRSK